MSCFSSEWPHHYHHQNTVTDHENNVLSADDSSFLSRINDLRPNKIRKSRASKRSPVTVLNADVSNFRALVQQLTGRPSVPTRLRTQRRTLNIDFSQSKEFNLVDGVNNTAPKMLPFMFNKYHHQQQHQQQQQQLQVVMEHKQDLVSSSSGQSKESFAEYCDDDSRTNYDYWDEFDDLRVEQCLEELAWVSTTNVDDSIAV